MSELNCYEKLCNPKHLTAKTDFYFKEICLPDEKSEETLKGKLNDIEKELNDEDLQLIKLTNKITISESDNRVKYTLTANDKDFAKYKFQKGVNYDCFNYLLKSSKPQIKKKNIFIIHHNDLDGESSASLVYHTVNKIISSFSKDTITTVKTFKWAYDTKEFDSIVDNIKRTNWLATKEDTANYIYIVDLSPTANELKVLNLLLNNDDDRMVLIDHHETSLTTVDTLIKTYKTECTNFHYFVDTRFSACYLTAMLVSHTDNILRINSSISFAFPALSMVYDLHLLKQFPTVFEDAVALNQAFYDYGTMSCFNTSWKNLLFDINGIENTKRMVIAGKKLIELDKAKKQLLYDSDVKYKTSCLSDIKNWSIIGLYGRGNSSRITEDCDIQIVVQFKNNGENIVAGIYSDNEEVKDLNLGKIVQYYSLGGGHPGACGISLKKKELLIINRIFNDGLTPEIIKELKNPFINPLNSLCQDYFCKDYKKITTKSEAISQLPISIIGSSDNMFRYEPTIETMVTCISKLIELYYKAHKGE